MELVEKTMKKLKTNDKEFAKIQLRKAFLNEIQNLEARCMAHKYRSELEQKSKKINDFGSDLGDRGVDVISFRSPS